MESARNSLVLDHLSRLAKLDSIESYLCDIIRAGPRGTGGINYPFCPISDTPGVDQLNQCASEGGFISRSRKWAMGPHTAGLEPLSIEYELFRLRKFASMRCFMGPAVLATVSLLYQIGFAEQVLEHSLTCLLLVFLKILTE
ncbi:hypothetical protein TNIN_159611 [Trichonephila inaurata madagascariensis]|uniref:Uncharacterized protein n=1 Tax=Trichonephila inaurata madagascariensis TaxID=2747483 RepID=A0A8X6JYW9_9ARAC|nr:hypothetical protein TNIN_159611 [Trichonephila inaurata madagascariensis]